MNKTTAISVGFLIIFFGTAFVQFYGNGVQKKEIKIQSIAVRQTIIDGKKESESYTKIAPGSTALRHLISTNKVGTKGEKQSAFVTMINGRIADPQKNEFWAFYVNGKQASVGAGTYVIKNNDTIEWKIETY